MPSETIRPKSEVLAQVAQLVLGQVPADPAALTLDRLKGCPEAKLAEAARILGLDSTGDLDLAALAGRVAEAAAELGAGAELPDAGEDVGAVTLSKFDLGRTEAPPPPQHIPWSYGRDRVTAMVVSPQTLFVYWEVTDQALEGARAGLGPGGSDAWPNLRVYDVSGRIFDGTNAHSYFDVKVDRSDRQWFLQIGKPGSTTIVDLGLKSREGYFVKVARSGRADFPRHAPAQPGPVEWLTVRTATGEIGALTSGESAFPQAQGSMGGDAGAAGAAPPGRGVGAPPRPPHIEQVLWRMITERIWGEGLEVIRREWMEGGRTFEWMGPLIRTAWEAGPFPVPVEVPGPVTERYEGPVTVYAVDGRTRIVFGPWRIVIRGLGGWAEKRILTTWNITTSWVVGEGVLRELQRSVVSPVVGAGGASEALLEGASELRWILGSEARLGGASEIYLLGASELSQLGASETFLLGASEYRFRGASEMLVAGASEWRLGGASEEILGGASERVGWGASELRLGGASEAWGGASETPIPPAVG
jgi:hypothetical protein